MSDIIQKVMKYGIPAVETGLGVATANPALIATGGVQLAGAAGGDIFGSGAPKPPAPTQQNPFAPAAAPASAPTTDYPASSGTTGIAAPSFAGSGGGGSGDQNSMIQQAIAQALQQQQTGQQAYGSF